MHKNKGLGIKPDGKWTADDHKQRLFKLVPQMLEYYLQM